MKRLGSKTLRACHAVFIYPVLCFCSCSDEKLQQLTFHHGENVDIIITILINPLGLWSHPGRQSLILGVIWLLFHL